jgi:hypothetical protein
MNRADVIKLAKIFDQFISLKSSIVKLEDISAIRKIPNGIEVVTNNGTFKDGEEYERLMTRVADALEVVRVNSADVIKPTPPPGRVGTEGSMPTPINTQPQTERKVIQLDSGVMKRRTTIPVGANGAQGSLFSDDTIIITDREKLQVLDPNGNIVAEPATGKTASTSSIKSPDDGDSVSGFIYNTGRYSLSFKTYAYTEATVVYLVKKKATVDNG